MKTNITKELMAAVLAVIMLVGILAIPASAAYTVNANGEIVFTPDAPNKPVDTVQFTDVKPGDWYYDAVMTMANAGIVNGVGDGKFSPNSNITWAQWATMLWRISLEDEKPIAAMSKNTAHWGTATMANLNSVLRACPDVPYSRVTIEDRAVTRVEAANYLGHFFYGQPNIEATKDITTADIPDWDEVLAACTERQVNGVWIEVYEDCVWPVIQAGIINGVDTSNTFNPNGTLTRAQFCQLLYNAGVRGTMYDQFHRNALH